MGKSPKQPLAWQGNLLPQQSAVGDGAIQIAHMQDSVRLHIDKSTHQHVYQEQPRVIVIPESKLQTEFARTTGIWCPKAARLWLEQLMENHHFTARELAVCWKAGPLGWNSDQCVPRINVSLAGALFAYAVIGVMTLYFLGVAFIVLLGDSTPSLQARIAVYIFGMLYLAVCWMAYRFILWPRRIALRVVRTQEQQGNCHAAHLS